MSYTPEFKRVRFEELSTLNELVNKLCGIKYGLFKIDKIVSLTSDDYRALQNLNGFRSATYNWMNMTQLPREDKFMTKLEELTSFLTKLKEQKNFNKEHEQLINDCEDTINAIRTAYELTK